MSNDVIVGEDGTPRCAWAGAADTALARYHDEVWGARTHDESAMFEALTLGVFEVGLSWSIVFGKRDAFWRAFHSFDVAKVAAMTGRDVERLLQDSSIIRNRRKIQAGKRLFEAGEPADTLYIVESGRFRVFMAERPGGS